MPEHEIKVIPIPDLLRFRDHVDKEHTIVIQIQNHKNNLIRHIPMINAMATYLYFDDVDRDKEGFIVKSDAKTIIEIGKWLSNLEKEYFVYVCCYAGLSRSPAVATALNEVLFRETKNSIYRFEMCNTMNKYQFYNHDILDFIRRIYNEIKRTNG